MEPQLLSVIDQEELKAWHDWFWQDWQIEAKKDGFRLLIVGGTPQSRSGKPLHNIDHIIEWAKQYPNVVFDGELHGSSWKETSHVARASKSERDTKLTYTIFDCLSIREWQNKFCDRPLWERQEVLRKQITETDHIKLVKPWNGHSYEVFSELHRLNLKAGCDGTVLKRKDSFYEFRRTKTWLKVKPVLDVDCLVVSMKEGKGKYKGMLGALEVVPEWGVMSAVGEKAVSTSISGMDDDQREEWWGNPSLVLQQWIEVSYRKVNPSGRLVEPRFVRVRTDK